MIRAAAFAFVSGLALLFLAFAALADGDCKGHSCNGDGGTTVDTQVDVGLRSDTIVSTSNSQGNINAGGDRYDSLGIGIAAPGFGDVAIVGCVISKQTSIAIVGWQRYDYDVWCMADRFDQWGKHADAAALRCEIKALREAFGDRCEAAATFAGPPAGAVADVEDDDEPEDRDDEHEQMIIEYRALAERVQSLSGELRDVRQAARSNDELAREVARIKRSKQNAKEIIREAQQ